MRRKFIACLAVGAMLATMVPGAVSAADTENAANDNSGKVLKEEITTPQTYNINGEVVKTVYVGALNGGKVNVIVTSASGYIEPSESGWSYYNEGLYGKQWHKVYDVNADNEKVTFNANYNSNTNSWDDSQTITIDFHKFDTEAPVINTDAVPTVLPDAELGEDYELPSLPVTDDITADFTTNEIGSVYYSKTGEDGTWETADSFSTDKEGYYNIRYKATDLSGKTSTASAYKQVHVVDTTAPTVTIEKIADMEKGDKLNISDVKVNAEDKSGIDKVWLNEILYSETNESWEDYESVWKLGYGTDPITEYEMDKAGYYKLKYRVTDKAENQNTAYPSVIVKVDEIYGTGGFTLNYVDKDGNKVGDSTYVGKEDAVLDYEYDENGDKETFMEFKYKEDGFEAQPPAGYYIASQDDFNDVTDPMRVYVENGGENTDAQYDITVTKEKAEAASDKEDKGEVTPPKTPKTGDDMNVALLAGLMALTAAAGAGTVFARKKVMK